MRLWSLFSEGNKTSDIPQFPNNYSTACNNEGQAGSWKWKAFVHVKVYKPTLTGNTADLVVQVHAKKSKEPRS